MSKKAFLVILVLSLVLNYIALITDSILQNTFIAGDAGFPFKFSNGGITGGESTNYFLLLFDLIFWFVVVYFIWRILKRGKHH